MADHLFLEENGYFAYAFASEMADGKWEAFVVFERKADHQKTLVPCVKHRLVKQFEEFDRAMAAAGEFALDRMQRDETGL
ncbi:hypothetical protein [Cupriavidus oxalaticus]|uniref:hypothetical protein n=1 Tax=Cupriavidus oxalaticus TaxID=96344 RepID=UPI0031827C15